MTTNPRFLQFECIFSFFAFICASSRTVKSLILSCVCGGCRRRCCCCCTIPVVPVRQPTRSSSMKAERETHLRNDNSLLAVYLSWLYNTRVDQGANKRRWLPPIGGMCATRIEHPSAEDRTISRLSVTQRSQAANEISEEQQKIDVEKITVANRFRSKFVSDSR